MQFKLKGGSVMTSYMATRGHRLNFNPIYLSNNKSLLIYFSIKSVFFQLLFN